MGGPEPILHGSPTSYETAPAAIHHMTPFGALELHPELQLAVVSR